MQGIKNDVMLSSVKVIATDLDGTLLDGDSNIPPQLTERILALEEAGVTFCAASGRSMYTLYDLFPNDIEHMAFISDNGGAVSCGGTMVSTSIIAPETYRGFIEFAQENTEGAYPVVCALDRAYIASGARAWDDAMNGFFSKLSYVDSFDDLDVACDKLSVYYPAGTSDEICEQWYMPRYGKDYSVASVMKTWVDLTNLGVDKGSALKQLCHYLCADPIDAVAMGDDFNDVQMLKAAGHSYAMDNAADAIKELARFVAPKNTEYGVIQLIDAVLAAKGMPFSS